MGGVGVGVGGGGMRECTLYDEYVTSSDTWVAKCQFGHPEISTPTENATKDL